MTDDEFLDHRRRQLCLSVEYFGNKKKHERELWVSRAFCRALRLRFGSADHISSLEDPPDVLFRDAKFEFKEVLDSGRPRHAEYKAALRAALAASSPTDLLSNEEFEPVMLPPALVADHVRQRLERLNSHYAPEVRKSLDLLVYVNLSSHFFEHGPMPAPESFAAFGWRSVSAYENSASLILFAAPGAPRFLRQRQGQYRVRLDV